MQIVVLAAHRRQLTAVKGAAELRTRPTARLPAPNTPTTQLLLQHKYTADADRTSTSTAQPNSCSHTHLGVLTAAMQNTAAPPIH
jgi:hypothetical protein